jgi:hypothetical protein
MGDDDDTVEFPSVAEDDGPGCGTAEAATYLLITYTDCGELRFIERHLCCYRHIPHPAEVLPAHAHLIEVVLEDGRGKTVVRDGGAEITCNDETIFIPAFIPAF